MSHLQVSSAGLLARVSGKCVMSITDVWHWTVTESSTDPPAVPPAVPTTHPPTHTTIN